MKLKKDYLTTEELINVVTAMIGADGELTRQIIKYGVLTQILIDDIEEKETCDEYADLYFAQSDIDFARDINNYYLIDEIINKELGIEKTVELFLAELNNKIEEYAKNINPEELLGKVRELISIGEKTI